ncbi:TPA: hypothetical protein HA259_03335 [Thermoplasmata archaeon]|nr:hypothetical protein [Thermoplasmata archaeon]
MASEKDDFEELLEEIEEENAPEPPPPPEDAEVEALPAEEPRPEFDGDPQEMWIEEYEREGRPPRKPKEERAKPRHIGRWIVLAAVIVILVVWTLISPPVMSVVGNQYVDSPEYSNLGSEVAEQNVQIIASVMSVGTTTWGVSIAGEPNATVGIDAVFEVMVTKVSEESGGFWFMGTEISLRNVSMYLEDDTLIGWMTEKDELGNMSLGYVHATFPENGVQDCYVVLRFSVYEVMRIGFLPADKVTMTIYLSDSIAVSEWTGPNP